APWNKLSVIGSIGIGISSLVAGIFFKNYRSVLLPLGISSTSLGVLFGLFPSVKEVPPGGRLRVPGQRAGSKITLRSPGPNQNIKGRNISSNVQLRPARSGNTFAQKNPEERLLILKKEEQDLELKKEADRLEAELKFKTLIIRNNNRFRTPVCQRFARVH
ncbi:unnamed protein product, partial [marine sediment metagenome]